MTTSRSCGFHDRAEKRSEPNQPLEKFAPALLVSASTKLKHQLGVLHHLVIDDSAHSKHDSGSIRRNRDGDIAGGDGIRTEIEIQPHEWMTLGPRGAPSDEIRCGCEQRQRCRCNPSHPGVRLGGVGPRGPPARRAGSRRTDVDKNALSVLARKPSL